MALPTPSEKCLRDLEKPCIHFIWNSKRPEFNIGLLHQKEEKRGLNLINIFDFNSDSLKITWTKKLISESPERRAFAFLYKIDRLSQTNMLHHEIISQKQETLFARVWQ